MTTVRKLLSEGDFIQEKWTHPYKGTPLGAVSTDTGVKRGSFKTLKRSVRKKECLSEKKTCSLDMVHCGC